MTNKIRQIYEILNKPRKELLLVVIPVLVGIVLVIIGYGLYQLKHQHDDRDRFIFTLHKISKMKPKSISLVFNINSSSNKKCVTVVDENDLKKAMELLGNAGGAHYQSHAKEKERFNMILIADGKQYEFLGKIYQDSSNDAFLTRKFMYEDEEVSTVNIDMPPRILSFGNWVIDKYTDSVSCE